MTAIARQNTLFVSEDWIAAYAAMTNVDFRAYDFDNLVQAMLTYVNVNYPEEFTDWVASSEFITKIEVLAWLSQNIAFRVDLNTRENFLATAERRESLIRLAQGVAYKVSRVRSSSGQVKILKIRTTQTILDSNGTDLANKNITWNDATNDDSFEQFILVMNSAFTPRTQFGRPLSSFNGAEVRTEQYTFNSIAPTRGTFPLTVGVNRVSLPFDIFNATLNSETGEYNEVAPSSENFFSTFYQSDGNGIASETTGFFLPLVQGNIKFKDFTFDKAIVVRTVDLSIPNINRDDFFIQKIDNNSNPIEDWNQVDIVFGEGISFNTEPSSNNKIYELDTLSDDTVRIRFGDGKYGEIPVGRFRVWYRTANPEPLTVPVSSIQNNTVTIPYVINGIIEYLTLSTALINPLVNAAATETKFDIRTRANQIFHTQNRMVTGRDYNVFYLKDNAIKKVKTVNRTYAGHSRYSKLSDPTGLYQNVKIVAEDGRYYQDDTKVIDLYPADVNILPIEEFINNELQKIVGQLDKRTLYYDAYDPFPLVSTVAKYTWKQTNIVGTQSRGNIIDENGVGPTPPDVAANGTPVPVGGGAFGNLKYIDADAALIYGKLSGDTVFVERVIGDGTTPDGIILDSIIPDGTQLFYVMPPIRKTLNLAEIDNITIALENRLDFALSWDQINSKWNIITFENLDKNPTLSLRYQGDDTQTNLDSSWMVLLEFITGTELGDNWKITNIGLGNFFESAREVDFYFNNVEPIIDPETGEVNYDKVKLLACNESKDSLRRRRLGNPLESENCSPFIYKFIGDGVTTCFKLSEHPLPSDPIVFIDRVLQFSGTDYEIVPNATGDSICFTNPPPDGAIIEIIISEKLVVADVVVVYAVANGSDVQFSLDTTKSVNRENTFVYLDGVFQSVSMEYTTQMDSTGNYSIVFQSPPPAGLGMTLYAWVGIDNSIFSRYYFPIDNDPLPQTFNVPLANQSSDTMWVAIDGVIQDYEQFTVSDGLIPNTTDITITFPYDANLPQYTPSIYICGVTQIKYTITHTFSYLGDGNTRDYTLTGLTGIIPEKIMASLDGITQDGPWNSVTSVFPKISWFTKDDPNTGETIVSFKENIWQDGAITIFVTVGAVGQLGCGGDIGIGGDDDIGRDNTGDISTSSCLVSYLGKEVPMAVVDEIRHDDGYINTNGVVVTPPDEDLSGLADDPFLFNKLVMRDGFTDLVLWRRIEESGFSIWDPVNRYTSPMANYGFSTEGYPAEGELINTAEDKNGDIHYDLSSGNFLLANVITGVWELAPNQAEFRTAIGRDHLKFMWIHYAPDSHRIDPSVSNVMDVYLLTRAYDTSVRTWLNNNGNMDEVPIPPTSEGLRIQFGEFENYKTKSDSMIYHPSRYKLLFGRQAIPELRAVFKVIKTQGVTISDENLRVKVLATIDDYFNADNWEFGEIFYFTELSAYIHSALAPAVHSVVIVPANNDQAFGRLFQVRAEPDELFLSAASPEDVEIVQSFTDQTLKIGEL